MADDGNPQVNVDVSYDEATWSRKSASSTDTVKFLNGVDARRAAP